MDFMVSMLLGTRIGNKLIYAIAVNTYRIGDTVITIYTIYFETIG